MKRFLALVLVVSAVALACNPTAPDVHDFTTHAFAGDSVALASDVDSIPESRLVTITTTVYPRVTGKARLGLLIVSTGEGRFAIHSPVADTGSRAGMRRIYADVDLAANVSAKLDWRVELLDDDDYGIEAHAILDSVWVSDSSRYFGYASPEATSTTVDGGGYYPYAYSRRGLAVYP